MIVALDSRTITELGLSPSLISRNLHARVLDRLRRDRPRLIAYDHLFIGKRGRREDSVLSRAISRARPVLLATELGNRGAARVPAGERNPERLGALLGSVEILNDEDGLTRQLPYFREPPQAFAVAAAEFLRGRPLDPADFPDHAAPIDFSGPPGHIPSYSMSRVVRGELPAETFRGKVVFVGATAPVFPDVFPTPMSADPMPGVEVHAHSTSTILDGLPLKDAPAWLGVLLTLALALLAPVIALRLSALLTLAGALLGAVIFVVASQVAFEGGSILPMTYPMVGLTIGTIGAAGVDLWLETRQRHRLRQTFERFVPRQVVAAVLERTDEDLRLGGEELEATVLFCDLRGFSGFAERNSAATVIEALNRYLTDMTEAILAHDGTVVSYMGDGVMAVFGAPIEQADNADRAFAAARELIEKRLSSFNDWVREKDLGSDFRLGVGLCTGPVMSGNVGSARRLEYTAVGDTTNVAARLQVKNKDHGSQLLMAESTRVRLSVPESELIYVGEEDLPGRVRKIKIWGVRTPSEAAPSHTGVTV